MATFTSSKVQMKTTIGVFLLALAITCTSAARVLDEDESILPSTGPNSVGSPVNVVPPVGTGPGAGTTGGGAAAGTNGGGAAAGTNGGGAAAGTNGGGAAAGTNGGGAAAATNGGGAAAATTGGGAAAIGDPHHELVFYMHDILGGTNPSAVAVTGIVSNPAVSGQVAFAKPNGANLPINNGLPSNNNNNGMINNNNIPFLTGLSGNTANIGQNNGNNNNNLFSSQFGGSISQGNVLQKLMFGTMTVIDDELTEGHELGSGLIGKAQGFYVASDVDGKSQTMAFTAMFENGGYTDSISFFGVLRTAVSQSQLAIMGGTGKYVNAKGFATVKVFSDNNLQQQTDGVETLLQFTIYLAY